MYNASFTIEKAFGVWQSSNRHESTLQKANDTLSSSVSRVSRTWGQTQFRRSHPASLWQHTIKKRPGQMSPLPPWLHHCLQDRIISLLQVMHAAKYIEVKPTYKSYRTCHINIYIKTKT